MMMMVVATTILTTHNISDLNDSNSQSTICQKQNNQNQELPVSEANKQRQQIPCPRESDVVDFLRLFFSVSFFSAIVFFDETRYGMYDRCRRHHPLPLVKFQ